MIVNQVSVTSLLLEILNRPRGGNKHLQIAPVAVGVNTPKLQNS